MAEQGDGLPLSELADCERTLTADEEEALLEDEPLTTKQADISLHAKLEQRTPEPEDELAKPESDETATRDTELEENPDDKTTAMTNKQLEITPVDNEKTTNVADSAPLEQNLPHVEQESTTIKTDTIDADTSPIDSEKTLIDSEIKPLETENPPVEIDTEFHESFINDTVDSAVREQQLNEKNPTSNEELNIQGEPGNIVEEASITKMETINQSEATELTEAQHTDITASDITSKNEPQDTDMTDTNIKVVVAESVMSEIRKQEQKESLVDNADVEMSEPTSNKDVEIEEGSITMTNAEAESKNMPIVTMMAEDSLPEKPEIPEVHNDPNIVTHVSDSVTDGTKMLEEAKEKSDSEVIPERTVTMMAENEDAEMTEVEPTVTMLDVLKEQEEFENNANAVLGASDDKECTFVEGYVKRQALYACLTCCSDSKIDPTKRAGVCLACSLACHENHELIELYTKRNFRCDCGNPKFNNHPCILTPVKSELNIENKYDQNFSGLYCICHRPYPDSENPIDDEMIQCIVCEDWLHAAHLDATVPANDQYSEMICKSCMEKNDFLNDYTCYAINVKNNQVIDVANYDDKIIENGNEATMIAGEDGLISSNCGTVDEHAVKIEENGNASLKELDAKDSIKEKVTVDNKLQYATMEAQSDKANMEESSEPNEDNVSASKDLIENSENKLKEMGHNSELKIDYVEMSKDISDEQLEELEKSNQINEESKNNKYAENDTTQEKHENENINTATAKHDGEQPSDSIEEQSDESATEKTDVVEKNNPIDSEMKDLTEVGDMTKGHPTVELVASSTEAKDKAEDHTAVGPETSTDDVDAKSCAEMEINEGKESSADSKLNESSKDVQTEEDTKHPSTSALILNTTDAAYDENRTGTDIALDVSCTATEATMDFKTTPSDAALDVNATATDAALDVNTVTATDIETTAFNVSFEANNTSIDAVSDVNIIVQNENTKAKTEVASETELITDKKSTSLNTEDEAVNTESETNKTISDDVEMKDACENTAYILPNKESDQGTKVEVSVPLEETEKVANDIVSEGNKESHSDHGNKNVSTIHQNGDVGLDSKENNKRKLSSEEIENDEVSVKKSKINGSVCRRPKTATRKYKGATFWPCSWRQKLCSCNNCVAMYRDNAVLFLLDLEDTVSAYEDLGNAKNEGKSSQYEKGLQALSSLGRIQQINALTEYNRMKDKLLDFLKSFKDKQEVVKEEDIKEFFADMKPRREPDGVYFCR